MRGGGCCNIARNESADLLCLSDVAEKKFVFAMLCIGAMYL